jgi:hypothetical protein
MSSAIPGKPQVTFHARFTLKGDRAPHVRDTRYQPLPTGEVLEMWDGIAWRLLTKVLVSRWTHRRLRLKGRAALAAQETGAHPARTQRPAMHYQTQGKKSELQEGTAVDS